MSNVDLSNTSLSWTDNANCFNNISYLYKIFKKDTDFDDDEEIFSMVTDDLRNDVEVGMSVDVNFTVINTSLGCQFYATVIAQFGNRTSKAEKSQNIATIPAPPKIDFVELLANDGKMSLFIVKVAKDETLNCHPSDVKIHVDQYISKWLENGNGEISESYYTSSHLFVEEDFLSIDILDDPSVCDYKLSTTIETYGQMSEETSFTYHYGLIYFLNLFIFNHQINVLGLPDVVNVKQKGGISNEGKDGSIDISWQSVKGQCLAPEHVQFCVQINELESNRKMLGNGECYTYQCCSDVPTFSALYSPSSFAEQVIPSCRYQSSVTAVHHERQSEPVDSPIGDIIRAGNAPISVVDLKSSFKIIQIQPLLQLSKWNPPVPVAFLFIGMTLKTIVQIFHWNILFVFINSMKIVMSGNG